MMSGTFARPVRRRAPEEAAPSLGLSLSRARITHLPLPVALLLLAMLLPSELDFKIGSARLSCLRVVLLVFLPVVMARVVTGRGPALRNFDLLFVGAFVWYALAIFWKEPFEKAVQSGGIVFIEAIGGYCLARFYIRNAYQVLAVVKLLFVMVLITGVLAMAESLLSVPIAHQIASSISGAPAMPRGETRLGLLRAMSVFDHPILYGAFCAGVFGLVWYTEPDPLKRLFRALLVMTAAFFCLSAAPLHGIALVLAGAIWERATSRVPARVWITVGCFALLYLFLLIAANRPPLVVLTTNFVFDQSSTWYRLMIWDYATHNIMNNPVLGAPLGDWDRPAWMVSDSVDSYWLTTALWGGLPALVLFALSILTLLRAVHSRRAIAQHAEFRGCKYGWTATVLALSAVGATVHYWGALGVLFTFYIGLGAWLAEPRKTYGPSTETPMKAQPSRKRSYSF